MVGCGEGVEYLTSRGVGGPTDIGWARPAIQVAGKSRGGMFLFLLSPHFHFYSFLPCSSLSSPLQSLPSLFSLSVGDDTK